MSFDPRDKMWESIFDIYYECYFEEMVADGLLYRWSLLDDITKWLVALTASGSAISGWALWNTTEFKYVWIIFSGISAFLAITHSALSVQQRIKNWEASKAAFVDLRIEFEWLRQDISINPNFDIPECEKRLSMLRQRYRENMSRLSPDTLRTKKLDESTQIKLNKTIADQVQN
jgi:hypothetical protein